MQENDDMKKQYTKKQIVESIKYWKNQLKKLDESNGISKLGANISLRNTLMQHIALPEGFRMQVVLNKGARQSSLSVINADGLSPEYSEKYYSISKMRSQSDMSIEVITDKEFSYDDFEKLSNDLERAMRKTFGAGFQLHLDEPFVIPYADKLGRTWYIAFISFS